MVMQTRLCAGFDLAKGPSAHLVKRLLSNIGRRNFFMKGVLNGLWTNRQLHGPFDRDAMLPLDKGLIT